MTKLLLTVPEAAAALGISRSKLYQLIKAGPSPQSASTAPAASLPRPHRLHRPPHGRGRLMTDDPRTAEQPQARTRRASPSFAMAS